MDRATLVAAMQAAAEATAKPRPVDMPAWGGTVYVRQVTIAEAEEHQAALVDKKDTQRLAKAIARVICDANGDRVFDENDEGDLSLIARQGYATLVLLSEDTVRGGSQPGNVSAPSGNS